MGQWMTIRSSGQDSDTTPWQLPQVTWLSCRAAWWCRLSWMTKVLLILLLTHRLWSVLVAAG